MRHYAWLGIERQGGENVAFAPRVIALLPDFLDRPDVCGIGEIGLNLCTKNEVATLLELIELAMQRDEQLCSTRRIWSINIRRRLHDSRPAPGRPAAVDHNRVWIDHCEEHTIRPRARRGAHWAGLTLYPTTKR